MMCQGEEYFCPLVGWVDDKGRQLLIANNIDFFGKPVASPDLNGADNRTQKQLLNYKPDGRCSASTLAEALHEVVKPIKGDTERFLCSLSFPFG